MKSLLVGSCTEFISTLTNSEFSVNSREMRQDENNLLRIEQRTYYAKYDRRELMIHISEEKRKS